MYSDVCSFEDGALEIQHRTAAVDLFIKTQPVTSTKRGFWKQFQRRDAPSHNILVLWVLNWRPEGSVKDCKPQRMPMFGSYTWQCGVDKRRCIAKSFPSWLQQCTERHGATYKVPHSNSNDSYEFYGRGMYLLVFIKFFHLVLKCYSVVKTVGCFWAFCINKNQFNGIFSLQANCCSAG
jgi:hypothetical protein